MPEIFDLTANFCRGWICPTATAFSTIVPRVTSTSFIPPVFFPLRDQAYRPTLPSARMMRMISTLQSLRIRNLPVESYYARMARDFRRVGRGEQATGYSLVSSTTPFYDA